MSYNSQGILYFVTCIISSKEEKIIVFNHQLMNTPDIKSNQITSQIAPQTFA